MSDKDLFQAIERRDLQAVSRIIHQPQCSDCNDTQRVERNIDGCDVEVECVMCTPQYGLRARLYLEQRDEPREPRSWDEQAAYDAGSKTHGEI